VERICEAKSPRPIEHLGGSPELLATFRASTRKEMYDAAEQLKADRYLLATIGS
jgi:hypothetical protein